MLLWWIPVPIDYAIEGVQVGRGIYSEGYWDVRIGNLS